MSEQNDTVTLTVKEHMALTRKITRLTKKISDLEAEVDWVVDQARTQRRQHDAEVRDLKATIVRHERTITTHEQQAARTKNYMTALRKMLAMELDGTSPGQRGG